MTNVSVTNILAYLQSTESKGSHQVMPGWTTTIGCQVCTYIQECPSRELNCLCMMIITGTV